MRPNWKAYAKKAYRQGYERGRRERESWIPARDPPKESGEYQCVTVSIGADGMKSNIRFAKYDEKRGWEAVGGLGMPEIITYWRLVPEFPDIIGSLECLALLAKERIEQNGE